MARIVTGIKPTGAPHLGNYLGMIRPALELAREHEAYYFVADHHALNSSPDPDALHRRSVETAATLLALGLEPSRTALYRQSDVPEVFELATLLAPVTPKGLLNRAHAYKAIVGENARAERSPDAGVNMGLFTYPLLMAADILAPAAHLVPTGRDQRQHLDITRDVAGTFNARFGHLLTVPESHVDQRTETVIGTDGRKMSKSYGNLIPVLASPDDLRLAVMGIVTDSQPIEAPKDPERDVVFQLYRLVAPSEQVEVLRKRYLAGGVGYGDAKRQLVDVLIDTFAGARDRYAQVVADPGEIAATLDDGAQRVRHLAADTVDRVRQAVGIRPVTTGASER